MAHPTLTRTLRVAVALGAAAAWGCDGTEPIVGVIEGRVSVEDEPQAGVTVTLTSDTARTAVTDASGVFTFEASDGTYTVRVDGVPEDATFPGLSQTASITRTGEVVRVDFLGNWIRTSTIAGTVLANGEPVVNIVVQVTGPSTARTRTDGQGGFRLTGLRAGAYTVELSEYDPERFQFGTLMLEASAGVGQSAVLDFAGEVLPPRPPGSVVATKDGPYRVVVRWEDRSAYEAEYRVERRVGVGEWEELATLGPDATELSDEGLTPGTWYGYRIQACNEVGCSPFAQEAETRTQQIPPAAPGSFTAQAMGPFQVDLAWTDESFNEDGFHVERRGGDQTEWAEVAVLEPGATAHADAGLEPDTDYDYRVRACNEVGCSDYAPSATVSTPELPPLPPEQLAAVSRGSDRIDLTWRDVSDNETRFILERRIGPEWTHTFEVVANAVSWLDGGLVPGTSYTYRLKACNTGGCSPYTEEVSATTDQIPPPSPAALSAVASAADRVDLVWQYGGANETGLHVERRFQGAGPFSEVVVLPRGTRAWSDVGLETGRTFDYRVRACNEVGCSAYSNTATVTTVAPPENNLVVEGVHLTQAVQNMSGSVPLIEGKAGLLRVFVTTGLSNSFQPDVRIRLFNGGTMVQESTVSAPSASVPLSANQSTSSWDLSVPANLVVPGLAVTVEVDPGDAVAETDESDNTYPASGTHALTVQSPPDFDVVFVPVRQSVNGLEGVAGTGSAFIGGARAMFPITTFNTSSRATYVTNAPALESDDANNAWGQVLGEVAALRAVDGASAYYYGVVKVAYGGGVAGMGYVGAPISIGWDKGGASSVAAHEWGHNFGRRHAPCGGAPNPDASFPYGGGGTGVWGYNGSALLDPGVHKDLMGYCSPDWISDYTYEAVLGFRGASPVVARGQPSQAGLLVWGRVTDAGAVLEPAFQVQAPSLLPRSPGPYRVRGLDAGGRELFSLDFAGSELPAEAGGGRHFAFVVPASRLDGGTLAELRLTGPGGSTVLAAPPAGAPGAPAAAPVARRAADGAQVTWDAARFPMAMVREPATGQVVSFARGGQVSVPARGRDVEVLLSDGVRSVRHVLPIR